MRRLLEICRYIYGAVFVGTCFVFLFPLLVSMVPGYSVEGPTTLRAMLLGVCLVMSALGSGLAVIGIAIYDQVREMSARLDGLQFEIQQMRAEATRQD